MSRSGYSEDWDADYDVTNLYRGSVERAIKGKRGQAFLRSLKASLEGMAVKELAGHTWLDGDKACALGVAMRARGLTAMIERADPDDTSVPINVAHHLNIAEAMARELVWINDEGSGFGANPETDAQRWTRVHKWVCAQIGEAST